MSNLIRYRVKWNGFTGAPGYSTFYQNNATPTDFGGAIAAFFTAIKGHIPNPVNFEFPTSADVISDTDGALTGAFSVSPVTGFNGGDAGNYGAPAGAMVQWRTAVVMDKHRLVGKTFIVPVGAAGMQSNGTLDDTYKTTLQTAGAGLVAAMGGTLMVWHRPKKDASGAIIRPGGSAPVFNVTVPDRVSVLRSRRD